MAIRLEDEYSFFEPADADYPGGSFKNTSTPGGSDGTPLEKKWADDLIGARDAVLSDAGQGYSGAPDNANTSDFLTALKVIFLVAADAVSTAVADKIIRRDANGRAKVNHPSASNDIATKATVDTHAALTTPHSATSSPTANRLALFDANSRLKTGNAALASNDCVRKAEWDASRSVGDGQTWQDVSGSRALNVSYRNLTGRPIQVSVSYLPGAGTGANFETSVDDMTWLSLGVIGNSQTAATSTWVIPSGNYYRISGPLAGLKWAELR